MEPIWARGGAIAMSGRWRVCSKGMKRRIPLDGRKNVTAKSLAAVTFYRRTC